MNGPRKVVLVILGVFLILSLSSNFTITAQLDSREDMSWVDDAIRILSTSDGVINNTTLWEDECSSVIVTGSASKDGRAILMKNRDWLPDNSNRPIYVPATNSTYAYVGVNTNTMGINEKGLLQLQYIVTNLDIYHTIV